MRFQLPTRSRGWKNPGIELIISLGRRGALRNQASLNARIESGFNTIGGGVTGTSIGSPGSYANGDPTQRLGNSSG